MNTSRKNILFITQWQYKDPLVQTYTLPYVRIIQKITSCYSYVVSINYEINKISVTKRGDITSIEIPSAKRFLFLGWLFNILALRKIARKRKIEILHAWCTPGGAVAAILKKMDSNLKLIIDSFEPHAESMVEGKTWKKSGLKYKVLFYCEKLETELANYLIFAASGMEKYIQEKYKTIVTHYSVKPACVDLDAFSGKDIKNKELLSKYGLEDKIVGLYAGKFGGIYLEDETFEFIKHCQDFWDKDKFRLVLLSNVSDEYLKQKITAQGIEPTSIIKLFVPHNQIPQYLGLADFAISPYKPVPSKRYCTPIKNGEYWAMGLPVVITPHISVDSEIIEQNGAGAILNSLDGKGYQNAIEQINSIIKGKTRVEIYNQIRPLAERYRNFNIAENIYRKIYS